MDSRRGNFSPEKFTRSGTVDFWRSVVARRRQFSRGSASGPTQWSAARMFSGTAKGFSRASAEHSRKYRCSGIGCADWYIDEPDNYSVRYAQRAMGRDVFIQGRVEIIPDDIRAGLPRRVMRSLWMATIIAAITMSASYIPPGVAHAIRVGARRRGSWLTGRGHGFPS